jgi:hypothetical protein
MFSTHGYGKAHQEQLLQQAQTEYPQEKTSPHGTMVWRLVLAGATVIAIVVFATVFLYAGI